MREIKVKPANKARDRLEARGFVIGEVVVGGAMIGERGVQLLWLSAGQLFFQSFCELKIKVLKSAALIYKLSCMYTQGE